MIETKKRDHFLQLLCWFSSIKLSVLKEWEKSFSALLKDPDGLELFEGFLMSEFSEENIQFWKACERYKSMPDDLVEKEATQVYEEYIAPEAPRPVIFCIDLLS